MTLVCIKIVKALKINVNKMGRIIQALAFMDVEPRLLTNKWEKEYLTKISITKELLKLRKERLKQKRGDKK